MVLGTNLPRLQPTHRGHPGSPARIHVRAALALFLAAVVSGCATTGSNYPYFERIAIEVLPPTPVKEDEAVASAGELAAAGAAAGGAGALASGLFVSLLCGPWQGAPRSPLKTPREWLATWKTYSAHIT